MKKVLLLGNIPGDHKKSIGGATVLTKRMLDFLNEHFQGEITHVPIRKIWLSKGQVIDYALLMLKWPFIINKVDVITIHATSDFHLTVAPLLIWMARLKKKKMVYHFFGGSFHKRFMRLPGVWKSLLKKSVLSADTVLVETKEMVHFFTELGVKVKWLPNSRAPQTIRVSSRYEYNMVFISRVTPNKGVNEIIQAMDLLDNKYSIDIYGPLDTAHYTEEMFDGKSVNYKGILPDNEVLTTIQKYNVLLLPSYHPGEGYPGIIIEALSIGMPVISTKWNAIPEIIMHGENGLLVPVKQVDELANAMTYFTPENYPDFSAKALKSFDNFNSHKVFANLLSCYD